MRGNGNCLKRLKIEYLFRHPLPVPSLKLLWQNFCYPKTFICHWHDEFYLPAFRAPILLQLIRSWQYEWSLSLRAVSLFSSISFILVFSYFLFFFSCSTSSGNFVVTPMPMTVTTGSVSKFNCSAAAEAVIFQINGTTVNLLGNPDIEILVLPEMEPRLHMLQIVANEEYNNTRVRCVALNAVGDVTFSNEAELTIQGKVSFT